MMSAVTGRYRPSSTCLSAVVVTRGSARGVVSVPAVHDTLSPIKDTQY